MKKIIIISALSVLIIFIIILVIVENNNKNHKVDSQKTISDFHKNQEKFIILKEYMIKKNIGYELSTDNISNISDPKTKKAAEKLFNKLDYTSIIKVKDPHKQDSDFDIIFVKKYSKIKADEKIIYALNSKSYEGLIKKLDDNWFYSVQTYT